MRLVKLTITMAFVVALAACGRGSGLNFFPDGSVGQCGNGQAEQGEDCDGTDLAGNTCADLGFQGGTLGCTAGCAFDTDNCSNVTTCGDGEIQPPEECDGSNLAGADCRSLGFDGGTLACTGTCTFDTSACQGVGPVCGDGVQEGFEQCDGTDLAGVTCEALGFVGGRLDCAPDCTFDLSGCVSDECGNGTIDIGEECDGPDLGGLSCTDLGFTGGTLSCTGGCFYDTSACTLITCGNDIAEPGETCDGADLRGQTCQDLGYAGGLLQCTVNCGAYDEGACLNQICGDGQITGTEDCDGADLGGADCTDFGFTGGTLACDGTTCAFDTNGCTGGCTAGGGVAGCADNETGDTGTHPGATDDIDQWIGDGCTQWQMDGPEVIYQITGGASGELFQVDLTGLTADLDLIVVQDDGSGCNANLACVDQSDTSGLADEQVNFFAAPGVTYYIAIDGFSGVSGAFNITFQCSATEICNDGVDNNGDGLVDCLDPTCAADPSCFVRQVFEHFPTTGPDAWDLDGTTVTFTPDPGAPNGYVYSSVAGVGAYPTVPGSGNATQTVTFGAPDDSVEVAFPPGRIFDFFGSTYNSIWVGTHGYLTFGQGDTSFAESAANLTQGPPRIAGHWDRLDPLGGGTVTVDYFNNRASVTYDQIDDFFFGGTHSFQIELFWNGTIAITNLTHQGQDGLCGISEGGGSTGSAEVDLYTPAIIGGYFERFAPGAGDNFDLEDFLVTFVPAGVPQGYIFSVQSLAAGFPFPPGAGSLSSQILAWPGGDTSIEVTLSGGNTIDFFGQTYSSIHVGANGYITFGQGDGTWVNSAGNHFSLPRVSGHFYDWEPQNGGEVWVDEFATVGPLGYVIVVTFIDVPHFSNPNPIVSFQMVVSEFGNVLLSYDGVTTLGGLVGLSEGTAGSIPGETDFN